MCRIADTHTTLWIEASFAWRVHSISVFGWLLRTVDDEEFGLVFLWFQPEPIFSWTAVGIEGMSKSDVWGLFEELPLIPQRRLPMVRFQHQRSRYLRLTSPPSRLHCPGGPDRSYRWSAACGSLTTPACRGFDVTPNGGMRSVAGVKCRYKDFLADRVRTGRHRTDGVAEHAPSTVDSTIRQQRRRGWKTAPRAAPCPRTPFPPYNSRSD